MIVVDTNILAYLLITGERSVEAERALEKDPVWAAPILWRSELRNVLSLYMRKKGLTIEKALRIIEKADDLLQGREYGMTSRPVLELVVSSSCTAYDCEFVALAQDLGVPLLTVDKRVLNQFPQTAIALDDFVGKD